MKPIKMKTISFRVSEQEYEALKKHLKDKPYNASDLFRELIKRKVSK